MRPTSKFYGFHEQPKKVINGPRPSPLVINNHSQLIRKSSVSSTCVVADPKLHKQQRRPIIIYTQSPKVIHTKAQDFMALVQRLTGMSRTNDVKEASENFGSSLSDGSNNNSNETSSALRRGDETCIEGGANVQYNSSNLDFVDMPLFTPSSSDFFCSSARSVYKYSDSPYGILGTLISPSGLEFMKELPEY
ncbi:VQ motif-containing protein 8, chloroplastic-like [Abrus precatorius]|uniref:VQ motif-containing protein 8, chloroplastic-like n=1 Tax=Abrus precatorius TaxID=3816 RepID=A0A8B8MKF7_ABRPR|nr:VQ motif-containing protein 8, chloroplastic-like [Abrus precatorius]